MPRLTRFFLKNIERTLSAPLTLKTPLINHSNEIIQIYWLAKMSTRLWLIVLLLCSVFIYDCSCFLFSPLTASLTEVECKQYFTSNDLNKIIQAFHKCPKRYRPSYN
ncbi:unnamed protein product [Rotaria socialis]